MNEFEIMKKKTHLSFLYENNGNVSVALIIGGYDIMGPQLYSIHPHGSTDSLPFISMGSGSLAAMSILENSFNNYLDLNSALILSKESILAGIYNDMGSGNCIDLCIILKNSLIFNRNTWSSDNTSRSNKTLNEKFKG